MSEALEVIEIGGESFRTERELLDVAPARIAELDARARHAAKEAVSCAVAAGRLLIAVRERLPHGAFLAWVAANCPSVTARTAQRYMRLAEAVGAQAAEQGSAAPVADDRSLVQLYQDYGIVRHNPKHGGVREGAGRPAKDPAAEVAAAAGDPDLNWTEVSGYLRGIREFAVEGDGFGTLADDDLESAVVILTEAAERARALLAARREGPCGAAPVDAAEASSIIGRGL